MGALYRNLLKIAMFASFAGLCGTSSAGVMTIGCGGSLSCSLDQLNEDVEFRFSGPTPDSSVVFRNFQVTTSGNDPLVNTMVTPVMQDGYFVGLDYRSRYRGQNLLSLENNGQITREAGASISYSVSIEGGAFGARMAHAGFIAQGVVDPNFGGDSAASTRVRTILHPSGNEPEVTLTLGCTFGLEDCNTKRADFENHNPYSVLVTLESFHALLEPGVVAIGDFGYVYQQSLFFFDQWELLGVPLNPVTGDLMALIGPGDGGGPTLILDLPEPAQVPEPATTGLLGAGYAGLGFLLRRRNRRGQAA